MQVAGGGGEAAVAEQELDGADVDAGFEQMYGRVRLMVTHNGKQAYLIGNSGSPLRLVASNLSAQPERIPF